MGLFGILLFIATSGITIYYFPTLFFSISWEDLIEIKNNRAVDTAYIWKFLGWTTETAASQANRILTTSIVFCVMIAIMTFASIMYSYRKR